MQQTASLVVNPIMVGNFAFLFNCTPVDQTSDYEGSDFHVCIEEMVGAWCFGCCQAHRDLPVGITFFSVIQIYMYALLSPFLCFMSF